MEKQRILKEAQIIASQFSFWMVSGNIAHLYGAVYETSEQKFIIEVKFDETFPHAPPQIIFHQEIKDLLGDINLDKMKNWTPDLRVVDIIKELKGKIQSTLSGTAKIEEDLAPIQPPVEQSVLEQKSNEESQKSEEYITPDYSKYPAEELSLQQDSFITPDYYEEEKPKEESFQPLKPETQSFTEETFTMPLKVTTELGLIQMEYPIDQKGKNKADIDVYLTITLEKTFIIGIDFNDYPKKPIVTFPEKIINLLGEPEKELDLLKKWNSKSPPHIAELIREIESKLFFIKDIEVQCKKISGEYQAESIEGNISKLNVHLLTYGFKEYNLEIDINKYPNTPVLQYSPELNSLIQISPSKLDSIKSWIPKQSEVVDILREISWLVDKNSRVNFEINLLKGGIDELQFDAFTNTINLKMKGKMKTENIIFEFQAILPPNYPMNPPELKVLNEFEDESHEPIKKKLEASIQQFFDNWTPFTYLIDLFNVISKKIFEVSVISCVICHQIQCPDSACKLPIASADGNQCRTECPYCERLYHKHCWDQTISSFGKCGFCLKTPPPHMMP